MDYYKYPNRLTEPDTIRLLRLLPDPDRTAPIRCHLVVYPLSSRKSGAHRYDCLSYVWGDPTHKVPIFVGEQEEQFDATANLYDALVHLRDPTFDTTLWVDSICINQTDTEEKSQQVQFMARIYGCAQRVVVWLGKELDNSTQAFRFISDAAASNQKTPDNEVTKTSLMKMARNPAVVALLERPWFRRIWVLQEVAAAREIVIACGSEELNGLVFFLGLQHLDTACADPPALPNCVRSVAYLVQKTAFMYNQKGKLDLQMQPLERLIDMFHTHGATDSRDKVFALLGMSMEPSAVTGLQVNYELDWSTVFRGLLQFLFRADGCTISHITNDSAYIQTTGHILGRVRSVVKNDWGHSRTVEILSGNPLQSFDEDGQQTLQLTFTVGAKSVMIGDIVCYSQSIGRILVIRQAELGFCIVSFTSSSTDLDVCEKEHVRWKEFLCELPLIWTWKDPLPASSTTNADCTVSRQMDALTQARDAKEAKILRATARILECLGEYDEALLSLQDYLKLTATLSHPGDEPQRSVVLSLERLRLKSTRLKKAQLPTLQYSLDIRSLVPKLARACGIPVKMRGWDEPRKYGSEVMAKCVALPLDERMQEFPAPADTDMVRMFMRMESDKQHVLDHLMRRGFEIEGTGRTENVTSLLALYTELLPDHDKGALSRILPDLLLIAAQRKETPKAILHTLSAHVTRDTEIPPNVVLAIAQGDVGGSALRRLREVLGDRLFLSQEIALAATEQYVNMVELFPNRVGKDFIIDEALLYAAARTKDLGLMSLLRRRADPLVVDLYDIRHHSGQLLNGEAGHVGLWGAVPRRRSLD